ncbi:MAG: hypothetical protein WCJ29_04355 [bacterium]
MKIKVWQLLAALAVVFVVSVGIFISLTNTPSGSYVNNGGYIVDDTESKTLNVFQKEPANVTRLLPDVTQKLPADQIAKAKELFKKNGIDSEGVVFTEFRETEYEGHWVVRGTRYFKGIHVLNDDLSLSFDKNGVILAMDNLPRIDIQGKRWPRTEKIDDSISVTPKISLEDVKKIAVNIDDMYYSSPKQRNEELSPLTAELGLVNENFLSTGIGTRGYVLVWYLKRAGSSYFPHAYIDATSGAVMYQNRGMEFDL